LNYEKIYKDLCESRKARKLCSEAGYEIHHIIPRSAGGNNKVENLVKLSCREHYIAHKLLTKIYVNDKTLYPKMISALWFMSQNTLDRGGFCKTSKEYSKNREQFFLTSVPKLMQTNSHRNEIFRTYHKRMKVKVDLIKRFINKYMECHKTVKRSLGRHHCRLKRKVLYTSREEGFFMLCYTLCKMGYQGISVAHSDIKTYINKFEDFFNTTKTTNGNREYIFSEKAIKVFNSLRVNVCKSCLLHALRVDKFTGVRKFIDKWNSNNPKRLLYTIKVGEHCYLLPINSWDYSEVNFIMKPLSSYDINLLHRI
jgi:hypothetical protein